MTKDKLVELVTFYRKVCESHFETARLAYTTYPVKGSRVQVGPERLEDDPSITSHIAWMCDRILQDYIPNGNIEKAMRWLGFIQGCFVWAGIYNLEEIRTHSRVNEAPTSVEE